MLEVNYKQTGWLLFEINFDVCLKRSFVEAVLSSAYQQLFTLVWGLFHMTLKKHRLVETY